MALTRTNNYDYSGVLSDFNYHNIQRLPNGAENGSSLALKSSTEGVYLYWPDIYGYWKFNENVSLDGTSGEIVNYHPNTETVWNTGKLSDFAVNNITTQYVDGKLGKALQFSGTYNVGYNNNTNMHLVELAPDLTNDYVYDNISQSGFRVSFWLRIDASPSSSSEARYIPIIACGGWDDDHWTLGSVFFVRIENTGSSGKSMWSRINFWWMNSSTGASDNIRWDFDFNVGQWYYISCYMNQTGHGDIWINNNYKYGGDGSINPANVMSGVKDNPLPLVIGAYRTYETDYNFVYDYNFTIDNLYFDSFSSTNTEAVFYNSGDGVEVSQRYETEGWIDNNIYLDILNITDFDASYTDNYGEVKFFLDKYDGSSHYYYYYNISSNQWEETSVIDSSHTNTYNDFLSNLDKVTQQISGFGDTSTNIGVYLNSNDSGINSPKIDWTFLEGYNQSDIKIGQLKFTMEEFEGLTKYAIKFAAKVPALINRFIKFNVQPFSGLKDVLFKFAVKIKDIKKYGIKFTPALLKITNKIIKYNIVPFEGLKLNTIKFAVMLSKINLYGLRFSIQMINTISKGIKFTMTPFYEVKNGLLKFNILISSAVDYYAFKFNVIFSGIKNVFLKFTVLEDAKKYVSFKFKNMQEAFKKSILKFKVQPYEGGDNYGLKFKAIIKGIKQVSFSFNRLGVGMPHKVIRFTVVNFEWTKRSFSFCIDLIRKYGIMFMVRRAYKYLDRLRYDSNKKNNWTKEEDLQDE